MPKPKSPTLQAELLLHLYELRREPVMRQARSYVGGPFKPASADDLIDAIRRGDQQTAYILQVFGYWDMLSAFVLHGALTEALVYDTCQEMYFQWAKIQPYIKTFRAEMLRISEKWSPYRTYACMHLWRYKDNSPKVAAKKK